MGYRFDLKSANIIANLTFGNVFSCYKDIYDSQENYYGFLEFLNNFSDNMFSKNINSYSHLVKNIKDVIEGIGFQKISNEMTNERFNNEYSISRRFDYEDIDDARNQFRNDSLNIYYQYKPHSYSNLENPVLEGLNALSIIFKKCKVKSLLLPKINIKDKNMNDDFIMSENILREIVSWHPRESCLILQPKDRPYKNRVAIFNVFPKFEIALRQIDTWPAVMFWNNRKEIAFIPVRNESELLYPFEILRYESDSFNKLKSYADDKAPKNRYYFHLSDLHFGIKNTYVAEHRLKSLITTQVASLGIHDEIDFIITGDAIDSPTKVNQATYDDFSEFLEIKSGNQPIFVLGNHDINKHGIAHNRRNQNLAAIISQYPTVKVAEEIKVIFLLFNSNICGDWAEGEIGVEQMSEMGNLLDKIPNLAEYTLISVLHHHVKPIPKPDFYDSRWLEKIAPKKVENALRLRDADTFFDWMKQRNVKIVLHGHKHIPFISENEGIHIISCGSSTGQIVHKDEDKTYLSFNLLKFSKNTVTCTLFAEDLLGAGIKNIESKIIIY